MRALYGAFATAITYVHQTRTNPGLLVTSRTDDTVEHTAAAAAAQVSFKFAP